MSAYKKYFQQTLLENPYLPGPNDGSSMDAGINDFADDGTDPHAYDVEGISQHKDAIVQRFMNQIQGFANKLAPEAVKSSTFGQIKDTVGKVFKEIDKVNTYAGAKLDQLNNDAPAVIAMTIATDPSKNAAFQKLHKELTEFTTSIEEVEGKFATLKAKIEDFIGDVGEEESAPEAGAFGESVKKKIYKKVLKESSVYNRVASIIQSKLTDDEFGHHYDVDPADVASYIIKTYGETPSNRDIQRGLNEFINGSESTSKYEAPNANENVSHIEKEMENIAKDAFEMKSNKGKAYLMQQLTSLSKQYLAMARSSEMYNSMDEYIRRLKDLAKYGSSTDDDFDSVNEYERRREGR